MKQKFYTILLLVMAMLCLGANSAWAEETLGRDNLHSALSDIDKACEKEGTNFTLTFAFSNENLTETDIYVDVTYEGKIQLYTNGNGNYVVAPTESNVTIMNEDCSWMFSELSHLASVNFTNFVTSEVTDMNTMFWGCESLTSLDLSGFNTSKVENMFCMFNNCPNLTSIIVGDGWTTEKVTASEGMFGDSPKLKGQNGTAYSEDHTDADYAHVDGDYGLPGYLSRADGKVKIAESLASGASVSFDVTPDVDAVYTFTASDKDATIVIREKGAQIAKLAESSSPTFELAAGVTYTVTIENGTCWVMTNITVSISKQVIEYITLTVGETTTVGDLADGEYIYCKFTPATSGYYTFTANKEYAFVAVCSGSVYNPIIIGEDLGSCARVLQAGTTYLVAAINDTEEAMSGVTVTTAKVDLPALTLGANSNVTIPACTSVFSPVATFTPAKAGTYRFTIEPDDVYIIANTGDPDISSDTPGVYEAELEAGKIYALLTFSTTETTGTITVSRVVPTIDAATWKEVLAEINGARVEYSDTYTITFADSYSGSDEGISVGTGVKLYGGENSGYNYVVAPTVAGDVIMAPRDCRELFARLTNLTSLDLSSFNTSNVEFMNYMFYYCANLESLTISNFDMSNVKETDYMFTDCNDLYTLTMKALPYLLDKTFNTQFSGRTVNVVLDDNSVVYTGTNHLPEATSATYTRTMPTNATTGDVCTWGTAVLPFPVDPDEQTGVMPYEFSEVTSYSEASELKVKAATEAVAAGHPFLFKNTAGAATVTFTKTVEEGNTFALSSKIDGDVFYFNDSNGSFVEIGMEGTFKEQQIGTTEDEYYFVAQDQFWKAEVATTVKPFRGWFGIYFDNSGAGDGGYEDAPARTFNIVEADETEGIELIPDADGTLYMVNGQCLDIMGRQTATRQGLVIENGRVVWVK